MVERFGITEGQRIVIVDVGDKDRFVCRLIRPSYAGALAGMFGTTEENVAYFCGKRFMSMSS